MKMKLQKQWWTHIYMMVGITVIFDVLILGLLIFNSDINGYILSISMIIIDLIIVETIYESRKYLMTMEVQEKVFCSYLFGRLKCEVFTNKDIYYAIFKCYEPLTGIGKYIVISNEEFVYEKKKKTFWNRNEFIDYYDRTKQIIFPYDEKTKHLFPIEKWTCVN